MMHHTLAVLEKVSHFQKELNCFNDCKSQSKCKMQKTNFMWCVNITINVNSPPPPLQKAQSKKISFRGRDHTNFYTIK